MNAADLFSNRRCSNRLLSVPSTSSHHATALRQSVQLAEAHTRSTIMYYIRNSVLMPTDMKHFFSLWIPSPNLIRYKLFHGPLFLGITANQLYRRIHLTRNMCARKWISMQWVTVKQILRAPDRPTWGAHVNSVALIIPIKATILKSNKRQE